MPLEYKKLSRPPWKPSRMKDKMKVTKRQLRQIIKEERALLEEQYRSGTMRAEQIVDMLHGKGEPHTDILRALYSEIPEAVIPVLEKYAMDKGINVRAERD